MSYVASRAGEATIIGVGAISLLSVVTLRDDLAGSSGAAGASLGIAGRSLVAIHDWTFLFGPGFCVGVNGILLGWLMYRTGLMPPRAQWAFSPDPRTLTLRLTCPSSSTRSARTSTLASRSCGRSREKRATYNLRSTR